MSQESKFTDQEVNTILEEYKQCEGASIKSVFETRKDEFCNLFVQIPNITNIEYLSQIDFDQEDTAKIIRTIEENFNLEDCSKTMYDKFAFPYVVDENGTPNNITYTSDRLDSSQIDFIVKQEDEYGQHPLYFLNSCPGVNLIGIRAPEAEEYDSAEL